MFNEDEKKYLKTIVKKELDAFEKEGKTVLITETFPNFLAADAKYDEWLKNLIKKLE
jgi:hypothetical protein